MIASAHLYWQTFYHHHYHHHISEEESLSNTERRCGPKHRTRHITGLHSHASPSGRSKRSLYYLSYFLLHWTGFDLGIPTALHLLGMGVAEAFQP